jgi:hypothetical protein
MALTLASQSMKEYNQSINQFLESLQVYHVRDLSVMSQDDEI